MAWFHTGKAVMEEERMVKIGRNAKVIAAAGVGFIFLMEILLKHQSLWSLILTLLLVGLLCIAYGVGPGMAAAAAVPAGLLMAIPTGRTGYVAIFGSIVLLAAIFRPLGRMVCVTVFLFGAMGIGILFEPELLYEIIPQLLAGAVLFFLVPQRFLEQLGQLAKEYRGADLAREREELSWESKQIRMKSIESARRWQDLSESFSLLPAERELFLQAARSLMCEPRKQELAEERPRLELVQGISRAVGDREYISGDNYSIYRLDRARLLVALSDGMGSGRQAFQDSDQVICRMEQLLDSGFSLETATTMVHRWLLAQNREDVGTTLDAGVIDLISGEGSFLKAGAAATYLLRPLEGSTDGAWQVELLNPESMPLGILEELHTGMCRIRLRPGDILVMMTDGVLDGLSGEMKEERMRGFLEFEAGKLAHGDAARQSQSLAASILTFAQSDGQEDTVRDDMTILTFVVTAA